MAQSLDDEGFFDLKKRIEVSSGLRNRPVKFVPPAPPEVASGASTSLSCKTYLEIVFKDKAKDHLEKIQRDERIRRGEEIPEGAEPCPECGRMITPEMKAEHEQSLVHLQALPRAPMPTSLRRDRVGLVYLQKYGWDPDAPQGLGAERKGITAPVRAVPKHDTAGIGLLKQLQDNKKVKAYKRKEEAPKILGVKELRRQDDEQRKRTKRLEQELFGRDLSQYLGGDAG